MKENSKKPHVLAVSELAWTCPEAWLDFETTADVTPCDLAYEQPNAVAALRMASRLRGRGFNVYVTGLSGSGRTSTVRRILQEEVENGPVPDDLCYVNNFRDPRAPRLLRLPAGRGCRLEVGLAAAAARYETGLSSLRSSEAHRRRRQTVVREFEERQNALIQRFQEEVEQENFALVEVDLGAYKRHELAPVVGEQPVSMDELDSLVSQGRCSAEERERIRQRHPVLAARLSETTETLRSVGRELESAREQTDRRAAEPIVEEAIAEVREQLGIPRGERQGLDEYLDEVQEYLLAIFPDLFSAEVGGGENDEPIDPPESAALVALQVNVVVDRSSDTSRPIVEETEPTPRRLFGFVEPQRTPDGNFKTDIHSLRPGALHRADGGFLIVHASDLLAEEGAWPGLRRSMRTEQVSLFPGNPTEGPPLLLPEPSSVDVTVVLIGSPRVRDGLTLGDDEFSRLFKLVALFEERIPLKREIVASYVGFLAKVIAEEKILPVSASGVARTLEYMVRLSGSRRWFSTALRDYLDLVREASCFAESDGATCIGRSTIERALASRQARESILSVRMLDSIEQGVLEVALSGHCLGQVNGLAVVETGLESLGYPVRITATTAVGREGIIDVEREAELSGEIHTKASLILAGYLRSLFAQEIPLAVTASLCFEQSYGGVDGDSASAAELAALLSSLSGLPLRQDIAVTGAVDQHGQILAVGGANEKVEGFWRACRRVGWTGEQGVILPAASIDALQLDRGVREDVSAGSFAVYPVRHVSEVVRILSGVELGEPDAEGKWPKGTVGERVSARLKEMAQAGRRYGCS